MSRKIKLHTFNMLFQLFAYLADKTGGWRVFVRPKLLLGSLIVGLGLTIPKVMLAQNNNSHDNTKKDSVNHTVYDGSTMCYDIKVIDNKAPLEKIYQVVEQMPQYPGGDSAMMAFIHKNITPQPMAQCYSGIGGKVICQFIVEKDGSVTDITILRSIDPTCDKEAIRVLKLLPKFIPGKQNGQAVRVYYMLPVIFKP